METVNEKTQRVLSRYGLLLEDVLAHPQERYPCPSPPFPPEREYLFAADQQIALIVDQHKLLIGSVPGHKAWKALLQHSPEILDPDSQIVIKHGIGWVGPRVDLSQPWNVQHLRTPEGVFTVHADLGGGGKVLLEAVVVQAFDNPSQLESTNVSDAIKELAWAIWEYNDRDYE